MKTVYVAGKYTAPTKAGIVRNVQIAVVYSRELWKMGFGVHCPHTNSFLIDEKTAPYEQVITYCLLQVDSHDCMYLLPNWLDSPGAQRERARAMMLHKPIFYNLEQAEKWLKEQNAKSA